MVGGVCWASGREGFVLGFGLCVVCAAWESMGTSNVHSVIIDCCTASQVGGPMPRPYPTARHVMQVTSCIDDTSTPLDNTGICAFSTRATGICNPVLRQPCLLMSAPLVRGLDLLSCALCNWCAGHVPRHVRLLAVRWVQLKHAAAARCSAFSTVLAVFST